MAPIHARLATPVAPEVKRIVAQDDQVAAIREGRATARDGRPYVNGYAWRLVMDCGRIVRATAFLDTRALHALSE